MPSPVTRARGRAKSRRYLSGAPAAALEGAVAVESPPENPDEIRASQLMADFVHKETKDNARNNTAIAYNGKQNEFKQFCEAVYPNDEYRTIITHEKIYRFFFYTAFREQKARGGRHRNPPPRFLHEEYKELMKFFISAPEEGNASFAFPRSPNRS